MDFPTIALAQEAGGANKRRDKKKKKKSGGFQSMGLCEPVFRGIMKKGFKVPTPIQRKSIPLILSGRDVVAMARTGSGKTAAFLVPLLEKLKEHRPKFDVRSVILSPTRELALQTHSVAKQLGRFTTLGFCLLVGGASMEKQFMALSKHPDVIIATPGRLVHHLLEVKFSLKTVEYLVFDEADRLFEMGFAHQIHDIMSKMSASRQTLLFSATMPKMVAEFTRAGLRNPEIVRLDVESKISENLKMAFFILRKAEKMGGLFYILKHVIPQKQQALVFAATKHHVELLVNVCNAAGLDCCPVYGSMDSASRKINIAKFRARKVRFMIVTDVAARGIDIPLLDNVVNYDFPSRSKLFVHRVGRVARAGRDGTAYSLVSNDERAYMVDLFLFLGRGLLNNKKSQKQRHLPSKQQPGVENDGNEEEEEDGANSEEMYYGGFPRAELTEEVDICRNLIARHSLQKLHAVSERAYKMYYKTRSGASYASVTRGKKLEDGVHPLFCKNNKTKKMNEGGGGGGENGHSQDASSSYSANESGGVDMLRSIRQFRSKKTIFEQLQNSNKAGNRIMQTKRREHEYLIRERERQAKMNEGVGDGDDDLGSLEQDETKKEEEEGQSSSSRKNRKTNDELDSNNKSSENERKGDGGNQRTRINSNENKNDGGAISTSSSSKKVFAARKPRRRKRNGKKRSRGDQQKASASGGVGEEEGEERRKKKQKQKKRDFRDPKFFITGVPAENTDALDVHDKSRGDSNAMRIDDHILELDPEDAEALKQKRRVHKWDLKKKKYIQVQVDNITGGVNESGARISKKYVPQLYEKWKQRTHGGTINTAAMKAKKANDDVKEELKSKAEIRKQRQKKEKRKSYLKMKSKAKGKGRR